jgi:hypothetical protein
VGLVGGLGPAGVVHEAGGTIVSVTNDKTMSQYVHHTAQSAAEFSVDETTKQITMNITSHPNPAKVIEIPEDLAAVFVNLALHRTDLSRARAFLDEFDRQGGVEPGQRMSTVCKGLWHAALGSTFKCFQHSAARAEKFDADTIFGTDVTSPERAAFDLLKDLRNRHVLHDENDWMQPLPIAVVAMPGHQPVVSDFDCVVIEGVDTAHVEQLGTVVNAALAWVNGQIESQIGVIRDDLLARGYDELMALPAPSLTMASSGSIKQRRA